MSTTTISDTIQKLNKRIGYILKIVEERPNIPFLGVIAVHVGFISESLTRIQNEATEILLAIDLIERVIKEHATEGDE